MNQRPIRDGPADQEKDLSRHGKRCLVSMRMSNKYLISGINIKKYKIVIKENKMKHHDTELQKHERRIEQFGEELSERVWFVLSREKDTIIVERRDDLGKFYNLPVQEFLNSQAKTRYKIANITGMVMPYMRNSDYREFTQGVMDVAQAIAAALDELSALRDKMHMPDRNVQSRTTARC